MSLFNTFKRLFISSHTAVEPSLPTPVQEASELSSAELAVRVSNSWPLTIGTERHVHQERNVNYHNNEISGRCVGRIGELDGALMLYPFEDIPNWLTSLQIRLSVETEVGDVRVSLLEPGGSITTLAAPCTLAGQFAVINGRLALRCETDASSVRGLCYEAVII